MGGKGEGRLPFRKKEGRDSNTKWCLAIQNSLRNSEAQNLYALACILELEGAIMEAETIMLAFGSTDRRGISLRSYTERRLLVVLRAPNTNRLALRFLSSLFSSFFDN